MFSPASPLTSLERVSLAMQGREPDRVPFLLNLTMHGAREMGMALPAYLRDPAAMAEAQVRMRARYRHDCLLGVTYGSAELEAFGSESLFFEDGPPNAGAPVIRNPQDILRLEPPKIGDAPALRRALDLLARLKEKARGEVPVLGMAIAPFSLPIMQMGFEGYLRLIWEEPALHARLMAVNAAFCAEWANAQLEAGADAIGLADPVASTTVVTLEQFRRLGLPATTAARAAIRGATATFLASAAAIPSMDDLVRTGTNAVGIGPHEDLALAKAAAAGRVALVGNLDGISMRRWTAEEAEEQVKTAIAKAGPGGGYLLSDGHGEIPWQVPESVLEALSAAVERWGRYPLDWVAS